MTAWRCYIGSGHDCWWVGTRVLPAPSWPWSLKAGCQGSQCQGQHQEHRLRWLQDPLRWPCECLGDLLHLPQYHHHVSSSLVFWKPQWNMRIFSTVSVVLVNITSFVAKKHCCQVFGYVTFTVPTMFNPNLPPSLDCPWHDHTENGQVWQDDMQVWVQPCPRCCHALLHCKQVHQHFCWCLAGADQVCPLFIFTSFMIL